MSESKKYDLAFGEAHYNLFPELRYFTNGQAPFEDLEIYFKHQTGWPTYAATVFTAVAAGPAFLLFRYVFGFGQGISIGLVIGVFLFVNWLLLSLVIPKFRQRQIRAALRARLLELGITTCRNCAYDMRGSPDTCPECGTAHA